MKGHERGEKPNAEILAFMRFDKGVGSRGEDLKVFGILGHGKESAPIRKFGRKHGGIGGKKIVIWKTNSENSKNQGRTLEKNKTKNSPGVHPREKSLGCGHKRLEHLLGV